MELLEFLFLQRTFQGTDAILDLCGGSANAAIACINLNRAYLGKNPAMQIERPFMIDKP